MVLPSALVEDGAISRVVVASYSGRGTLAMAPLVVIGARLIGVFILAVFDLILFSAAVLVIGSIYALALGQAAARSFTNFFCLNKLEYFFETHVLVSVS